MNRNEEKIGKVMLDLSSKKTHLGCLNSKVDQTKTDILLMYRVLEGKETGHLKDGVFGVHSTPHVIDRQINWPKIEYISNLLEDINTTKEKIDFLEQQRRDFGV